MDLTGGPDPAKNQAGIYLKTQANTAYIVVSIEKTKAKGMLIADDVVLTDDDKNRIEHKPTVDLDQAMKPFWKGNRIVDESALLLSTSGGTPTGQLLFTPTKVISVKDATLQKTYVQGKDYRIDGNKVVALSGSSITTMKDSEFATGQYPWTELQGRHIFVTYEHKSAWKGPIPTFQGQHLPNTIVKLKTKKPLVVVAFGDSITLGINVSGFRNVPPYLPPWPSLFAMQIGKAYGNKQVKLVNAGLGGMTSQWAKDNAHDAVATLKPDLVLLAFGMNDFWSLEPKYFRENILATISTIRKVNPKCEFLLIGSMKFDPVYTTEEPYVSNLAGYVGVLQAMVGKGVAFFDMTTLSDALYKAKSQKDLATDPMHPDDFLARIYAQGAAATMIQP
jgi:lysophospholipase L1-like esterase